MDKIASLKEEFKNRLEDKLNLIRTEEQVKAKAMLLEQTVDL